MNKTQVEPITFHARSKSKVWLRLGVVLAIIMTVTTLSVAGFHWFHSVSEQDMQGIKIQAANYLSSFNNQREFAAVDSASVAMLATEKRGDFLAVLCRSFNGRYYACIFERDSVFRNRWYIAGATSASPGEMGSWNANIKGNSVLCFFGAELPDTATEYSFRNGGISYICPIKNRTVLNLFVILDTYDINASPEIQNIANSSSSGRLVCGAALPICKGTAGTAGKNLQFAA